MQLLSKSLAELSTQKFFDPVDSLDSPKLHLQAIGKDIFQNLCQWLSSKEILSLYCTCKKISSELDKVDREIWRDRVRFEIDRMDTPEDVKDYHTAEHMEAIWQTIDIIAKTAYDTVSWRKVYLQYHLFEPKTFIQYMMAEYLTYRLTKSR